MCSFIDSPKFRIHISDSFLHTAWLVAIALNALLLIRHSFTGTWNNLERPLVFITVAIILITSIPEFKRRFKKRNYA